MSLEEKSRQKILGLSRELLYYCSLKKKAQIIELIQSFDFKDCNINFQCGNGWSPLLQVCQSTYETFNENDTQEIIKFISKTLPHKPGVYQMESDEGKILYIGKAKNLKKRVYF